MEINLPQELQGVTRPFQGNGRRFGYPTANIHSDTALPDGVYFGYADLADFMHRPALIFIGTPTTVGDTERRVETHLLDIEDRDYYGLPILINLEKYYRPNETFKSIEALLAIMKEDEAAARDWFSVQS